MIKDKIVAVLECAQYLHETQLIPTSIIKQMIYSQLKDCSFTNIQTIAQGEDIDILLLIEENEKKHQSTKQKQKQKRDNERICTSKSG
jgi:hypothetical protein